MVDEYQRKAVKIPDEIALVMQPFLDNYLNHILKSVVPLANIITKQPDTWQALPAIFIKKVGATGMVKEQAVPGGIGSTWQTVIEIHLVTSRNSYCIYDSVRYDGAEKFLNVIYWIVYRMLSENRHYVSTTDATFHVDDIQPSSFRFIDGGYNGVGDLCALELTYLYDFEVVSRDG